MNPLNAESELRVEGINLDPFTIMVGLLQGESNSTRIFNVIFFYDYWNYSQEDGLC